MQRNGISMGGGGGRETESVTVFHPSPAITMRQQLRSLCCAVDGFMFWLC